MATTEPIFEPGQPVVATGSYGYAITEGKEYEVLEYTPRNPTPTFTWPAYVTVKGDFGKPITGHTHRFRRKA